MKDKDKDMIDEFRSKLYDFEADTAPDDWEAIVSRLPDKAPVPLWRTLRYWVAAAIVSLLVITGSMYWFNKQIVPSPVATTMDVQMDQPLLKTAKTPEVQEMASVVRSQRKPIVASVMKPVKEEVNIPTVFSVETEETETSDGIEEPRQLLASPEEQAEMERNIVTAEHPQQTTNKKKEAPARKWGFGMGAGGLSVGADNMVPQYVTNSASLRSESLMLMNAPYFNKELPKTDIRHKTPVSFGFSVSRYLNNRFSLQTGLTYSFLSSEWTTSGDYHGKTKQKLHFIGIPLSLSYKIAEWNRFNFYVAAGVMAELNVAGTVSAQLFNADEEMVRVNERIRMKELLWSVNTRGGVSYPVIRFVSAFAEVGAAYYFDNGSPIETVHSEKPLNVSLQFGFRLGF